jgi:putative phage-type endonuclease
MRRIFLLTMLRKGQQMDKQRTDEWFAARLGKVTASRVADLMATTKTGYAASRDNLMAQLVIEILTNQRQESYTNASMQWGTDQEPFARAAYEVTTGLMVDECGFVPHPTIEGAGASPDGLVGDDGLVEIKCPNSAGMIEALLTQTVPGKYNTQMQMQMACTGRQWCDYVVFDPRMPQKAQLFVKRVPRDADFIKKMEAEIVKFLAELNGKVNKLKELFE